MEYTITHSAATIAFGTPTHIPPEKWKNNELEPNIKFDVYSFGIMLWELFANRKPFERATLGNFEPVSHGWKFAL